MSTSGSNARRPARVLVADDSALVREVLCDLIDTSTEFAVAGTACDGEDAIRQVEALQPDIVTLDVEMPGVDGLETLRQIMQQSPRPVVMLSGQDGARGGALTIRALELGAVDFVRKPFATRDGAGMDLDALRDRLFDALRAASVVNLRGLTALADPALQTTPEADLPAAHVVVVAASTGGPRALTEVIPALPAPLGAAVLVVQHMPSGFTESLARRLNALTPLPVQEARHGEEILADHIYVAPGGRHMSVARRSDGYAIIVLDDSPPMRGMRPSADRLFHSVATVYGPCATGVVLTGMGRDGADGLRAMRARGAWSVVQDRASSIVYGMPSAALQDAGADVVCSLPEVAEAIAHGVRRAAE